MTDYRIAFIDDGNRLLTTYEHNGSTWSLIGTQLLLSTGVTSEICAIGENRIALTDNANGLLTAYSFAGDVWAQKGQQGALGFTYSTIAMIYPNRISLLGYDSTISDYPLRAYDFNDLYFSRMGNELVVPADITSDSTGLDLYTIAFIDDSSNELRTYYFDGDDWAQVGSSLTISGLNNPTITALSSTRIALFDDGNDQLRAYDWNGSTWSLVGSGLTISGCANASIDAISSSRIAFIDNNNQQLRVYYFNGSIWAQIGTQLSISCTYPKITGFYKPLPLKCYNEIPINHEAIWPTSG